MERESFFTQLDRVNVRACGHGGQGIIFLGYLLGKAAIFSGLHSVQIQRYGPESRGGNVSTDVSLSKHPIRFPKAKEVHVHVAMNQESYDRQQYLIPHGGIIVVNRSLVKVFHEQPNVFTIPATSIAIDEFNTPVLANVIVLGYMAKLLPFLLDKDAIISAIKESTRKNMVDKNLTAFALGMDWDGSKE